MIRFVYFDLGNVLIGFSHQRAAEQLAALSDLSPEEVYSRIFDTRLQLEYESGILDTSEFCERLRELLDVSVSDDRLTTAVADIFWPMYRTIPVLAGLVSAGMSLGVLSNTCEAHWDWVTTRTLPWMNRAFKTIILSFQVGSAKPDWRIFDQAIAASGVAAEEIFFTDDRPENVEAARAVGFRAFLFSGANALARDLRASGVESNY